MSDTKRSAIAFAMSTWPMPVPGHASMKIARRKIVLFAVARRQSASSQRAAACAVACLSFTNLAAAIAATRGVRGEMLRVHATSDAAAAA